MKLVLGVTALSISICSLAIAVHAKRERKRLIAQALENQRIMNEMNSRVNFYKESE